MQNATTAATMPAIWPELSFFFGAGTGTVIVICFGGGLGGGGSVPEPDPEPGGDGGGGGGGGLVVHACRTFAPELDMQSQMVDEPDSVV